MPDPLGPPKRFFRKQAIKEHLTHHGRRAYGTVVDKPSRSVYRPDGTFYLVPAGDLVEFRHGDYVYRVLGQPPMRQKTRRGQAITVLYCPYYPGDIHEILWKDVNPIRRAR
jgi:hypothetical protein